MRGSLILFLFLPLFTTAQWSGNTTPTYPELIEYYKKLDREHKEIELYAMGRSDLGVPLYVCIVNGAGDSTKTFEKARSQTTLLINNAIHPGEPDGVNACLIWIDDWIKAGKPIGNLPVIAIIPAYNVGGMFNRSSTSRANQNGPEEYGFRGNAQNLDLNRDFLKLDSPNAWTFVKIYQALDPDVFVDNHVSNGADYQYTLTMIYPMKERLAPALRELIYKGCIPEIEGRLLKKHQTPVIPYVETKEDIPDKGITAFNDLPRYAMGYATLFHALSFTVETHMLKPFPQRVEATRAFLDELIRYVSTHKKVIENARTNAINWANAESQMHFSYELTNHVDSIKFLGYKASYKPSEVTGLQRLYYDRSQPWEKNIPFYSEHMAKDSVKVPTYYIVNVSAVEAIARLKANRVTYRELNADSTVSVSVIEVLDYETGKRPYEGHYLHHNVKTHEHQRVVTIPKGSLIIPTVQSRRNFLVSALEPKGEDSYFAWNYFDSHIQQKEYFSPYVFDDMAKEILAKDPQLKTDFEEKKRTDAAFAASEWDQLYFIYRRSAYFEEKTFNLMPVYKVY